MTLSGIDVSAAGQGAGFPWQQYRGKIAFAGIKISEGTTYADPCARANIAGALSVGAVPVGYHFLHAGLSGSAQAEHFLSCAKAAGLKAGHLIAVDAEDLGLDGESPAQMNLTASAFAGELQRHFPGYNPVVYTEQSMAPSLTALARCPLWLADLSLPLVNSIGPWKLVSFWQTGQRGVDTDVFNGDAAELGRLTIPH